MTARNPKREYTGPDVVQSPNSTEFVRLNVPFEGHLSVLKSDLPELIERLQKFAPPPEHINPDEYAWNPPLGESKPKRKAKAKRGTRK